ncbi:ead/Ea22-like family protein [Escherichia coli]|uniref:ead/Ea22-like family protein n=1 Tax=Escherichia coli TaxID=562 RepID=UPI0021C0687F|nr:ead/Ea22-like family protein [Escherichia coli]
MSNIDKRALREIAESAVGAHERLSVMPPDDIFDISLAEGTQLDADITALNALNSVANPATVLALLDELEAKDQRIAVLSPLWLSASSSACHWLLIITVITQSPTKSSAITRPVNWRRRTPPSLTCGSVNVM